MTGAASGRATAVLFDLDGTLLDTLPDLLHAMNSALGEEGLDPISKRHLLPAVSAGTRSMIGRAAPSSGEALRERLRERFLALYEQNLGDFTAHFAGVPELLTWLDGHAVPFGVVTNKHERYSEPLLRRFSLDARAACLVCGDTATAPKPSPAPLLEAARRLDIEPARLVYIGDAPGDVRAANAAGMPALVAGWGYVAPGDDPAGWGQCEVIARPSHLPGWLAGYAGPSQASARG